MTFNVFDWLQSFQFWLDDTLPWRLRASRAAIKKESDSLCRELQRAIEELYQTKVNLREAIKHMHRPIRA